MGAVANMDWGLADVNCCGQELLHVLPGAVPQRHDVTKATSAVFEQSDSTAKPSVCQQQNMASIVLQVVQSLGFDVKQDFPIYADRMPTQLLAYLRLSRLQDSGEIAKVCFACGLSIA